MRRTQMNTSRFSSVRGATLPLLLALLAGAVGCQSTENANPYQSSDNDLGTPRSRPVLTADEQGRYVQQQRQVVVREETVTRTTRPEPRPATNTVSMVFPTGERSSSALLVERTAPTEVVVGAPFHYNIKVTNLTGMTLNNVFVTETGNDGIELTSANMRPIQGTPWNNQFYNFFNRAETTQGYGGEWNQQTTRTGHTWDVGSLAPHESRVIEAEARTEQSGAVNTCVFAGYNPEVCITMNAVAPSLQLRVMAPSEALVCEDIPLRYSITNTGTGTARDVRVRLPMPAGMRSTEGRDTAEFNVGELAAGQSKEITINTRADRTGQFTTSAQASADMGLTAESEQATVNVVQPMLAINFDAPATQYLGRDVGTRVTVTNTSNVTARDVRVNADMSGNVQLINEAGSPAGNSWNLGDLAPGEGKTAQLFFNLRNAGTVNGRVTANARCAEAKTAEFSTQVMGVPGLHLDVIDNPDPVLVGQDVIYTIRVTNQGSTPCTNIKITANIPEQLNFISARGAAEAGESTARATNRRFEFAPLPTLAPKATAEWQVRAKANATGDVRFGVTMTADQLDSPVEDIESTNLYQ